MTEWVFDEGDVLRVVRREDLSDADWELVIEFLEELARERGGSLEVA